MSCLSVAWRGTFDRQTTLKWVYALLGHPFAVSRKHLK